MNKTIKKLEANLIRALTFACEQAKVEVNGFEWLTHTADYSNFPSSILVRCIFDTDASLQMAKESDLHTTMVVHIHKALLKAGILLKTPKRHVLFDTEQACAREHEGNWKKRIQDKH